MTTAEWVFLAWLLALAGIGGYHATLPDCTAAQVEAGQTESCAPNRP